MQNKVTIPIAIVENFPSLDNASHVGRFSSPVPVAPDTYFDVFNLGDGTMLTLVSTDYPDPKDQSLELQMVSAPKHYVFESVLRPLGSGGGVRIILDHDEMDGDFIVKDQGTYYYVARTHSLDRA